MISWQKQKASTTAMTEPESEEEKVEEITTMAEEVETTEAGIITGTEAGGKQQVGNRQ